MDIRELGRVVVIVATLILLVYDCDAARSGGSRSSSRSSRSSSRSSRSSSRSFRSSSSGAYRGRVATGVSYTTVTTRTTVISTRYSRAYSSSRIGSVYWGYYSLYYYQAGLYSRRTYYPSGTTLCENYESDVNGSSIGWFQCPFPFEPNRYTVCCGDQYAEFCCEPEYGSLSAGAIAGIVILVLVIIIIAAVFVRRKYFMPSREPYTDVTTETHMTTTTTETHTALVEEPAPPKTPYELGPQAPPNYGMGGPVGSVEPPPYSSQMPYPSSPGAYPMPGPNAPTHEAPPADLSPPPPGFIASTAYPSDPAGAFAPPPTNQYPPPTYDHNASPWPTS